MTTKKQGGAQASVDLSDLIGDILPFPSSNLAVALDLAKRGYAVFPCRGKDDAAGKSRAPLIAKGFKGASTDEMKIRQWWNTWPDAIPALPTGKNSGFAVLDLDRHKVDEDGIEAIQARGFDPDQLSSLIVDTPRAGLHIYLAPSNCAETSVGRVAKGVDIRNEGAYVIAPGARLPDGSEWRARAPMPSKIDLALPSWPQALYTPLNAAGKGATHRVDLSDLLDEPRPVDWAKVKSALAAIPPDTGREEWIRVGMAIHAACSGDEFGFDLWNEWSASAPKVYDPCDIPKQWDSFGKRDGVGIGTLFHIAASYGWTPIVEISPDEFKDLEQLEGSDEFSATANGQTKSYSLDENGIIDAFTDRHSGELLFDHSAGKWFKFDGNVWRREDTRLAHHYARRLSTEFAKQGTGTTSRALKRVSSWESIERGARTVRHFAVTAGDWDCDPWLLGTPGGTVDLRTGTLRCGQSSDRIARLTAAAPIPLASFDARRDCPTWLNFLNEALGGDQLAIRFLQQWAGYSATGDTREQVLLFVYGPGGSGKGTAINSVADVLGEYSVNVPMETLTASKYDRHSTELARLNGARMARASETEKGRAWAENRIKNLTGQDKITARFMRQDDFEFVPAFKLTIFGNNRPSLKDVDTAMRRRFMVLPFDHPPSHKDTRLGEKLKAEFPGILSWVIQGCLDWQRNGLIRPDVVKHATDDYFTEQDSFGQWLAQCCETTDRAADTLDRLWESWRFFSMGNGEDAGSRNKTFPETLQQRGFSPVKDAWGIRGRGYRGVRVIEQDPFDALPESTRS